MKELVKSSRVVGYIEKMYRQLNTDKFNGQLEEPIITIQSTPRAYGHVTCGKVWKSKDIQRYELNIGAGTLDRPIESVVSTLLHEMVHIYHLQNDIQDCSRGNSYHNKKFRDKAKEVGLIIDYDERIGWSITSPSESLIDYICLHEWEDILINRQELVKIRTGIGSGAVNRPTEDNESAPSKRPSSTRKYQCPCCNMSVRATKTVNILCGDCNEKMIVAE